MLILPLKRLLGVALEAEAGGRAPEEFRVLRTVYFVAQEALAARHGGMDVLGRKPGAVVAAPAQVGALGK
jgi:hypothetical protein